MQQNIHPKYNNVTLNLPNGEVIKTKSTLPEGTVITSDIDRADHPAWREDGGIVVNKGSKKISAFAKKFPGFDSAYFTSTKDTSDKSNTEEKKD